MAKTQYYGTGRRKSSVARVRLVPGTGNITVNKKPLDEYLALDIVKREVRSGSAFAAAIAQTDDTETVLPSAAKSPAANKAPRAAKNAPMAKPVVDCPARRPSARVATRSAVFTRSSPP